MQNTPPTAQPHPSSGPMDCADIIGELLKPFNQGLAPPF
ncbi:hypothetical protein CEXT_38261, partial [Caerostris extrusa]